MVLNKHDLEKALRDEHQDVQAGRLKEDNPLDTSESFRLLCEACRRGDLKVCQEKITEGININARDRFDYTPLILASLCGHYEVVQLLLESGALCERDTFQGERCLYNALNDRIRNLLLAYDYSKSTDPLQPLAGHITSLLTRDHPKTWDIQLTMETRSMQLHKFVLASRSPYFAKKLQVNPETVSYKLPNTVPPESLRAVIRFLYFGELPTDFGGSEDEEAEILRGIDKLSRTLEVERLFENIIDSGDKRLNRQRRTDEVSRGRDQIESWFRSSVLSNKVLIDTEKAGTVKWDRSNAIFADVLLQADELEDPGDTTDRSASNKKPDTDGDSLHVIPIGPFGATSRSPSRTRKAGSRKSTLFPVHRAMLLRSEFFNAMFSSGFKEAQDTEYLQIVPVDCTPEVLEIVLTYLYTERADFGLEVAIDVLFAADLMFIDKLKVKAATTISTLGNGGASIVESENPRGETDTEDLLDVYDVIRAGWDTRVHRLEEFGARYLAYRLERYIDEEEFAELVQESANRIKQRQETDTVELIDDIRFYLSERYRLRFEDAGLEEMMDEDLLPEDARSLDNLDDLAVKPVVNGDHHGSPEGPDVSSLTGGLDQMKLSSASKIENSPRDLPQTALDSAEAHAVQAHLQGGVVRTLDGELAGDEFAQDAMNYQILLGKIDALLDKLRLDA